MNIFMTNNDFREKWERKPGYIVAVKVLSAEELGDT